MRSLLFITVLFACGCRIVVTETQIDENTLELATNTRGIKAEIIRTADGARTSKLDTDGVTLYDRIKTASGATLQAIGGLARRAGIAIGD